jgi:PII-like signaling protein
VIVKSSSYPTWPAKRATILCGMRDHFHHRSLVEELVVRSRRAHLAGATVFEALEGYGAPGTLHAQGLAADDSPACLVLVDRVEPMDTFLRDNADLLASVMVIVEDVEVVDLTSPGGSGR